MGRRRQNLTPRSALIGVVSLLAIAACTPTINQRGNLPTADALPQIKPGSTDKATVTRILGSPSNVASFDGSTWYYISQRTQELAFFKPQTIDQQVVSITFDQDGIVKDVRKIGMDEAREVDPVPRTTPAPGKELSFIEQLVGNFGRFNTTNVGKPQ